MTAAPVGFTRRLSNIGRGLKTTQSWLFEREHMESRAPRARAYVLFGIAALCYLAFSFGRQGESFLRGQMWAEMATNYYRVLAHGSFVEKLFGTDAGYIPLPQRLIAVGAELAHLPAEAIPYYFTSVAWVLAALMLSAVVLPTFRSVLPSDGLRFVLALAFIVVPDFESRTFLSFTYFAIVPILLVTAVAWVRPDTPVPGWAWLIPLFLLSKPVALTVIPVMLAVAFVSGPRFRRIALVSLGAGVIQLVSLVLSMRAGGSLAQQSDSSLLGKVAAAVKYFFALVTRYFVSPTLSFDQGVAILGGVVLLGTLIWFALRLRTSASALIYLTLITFAFVCLLNSVTFASDFSQKLSLLNNPVLDRRFIIGVFTVLFCVAAIVTFVTESAWFKRSLERLPPAVASLLSFTLPGVLLLAWFAGTGWPAYALEVNRPLAPPVGMLSTWEENAPALDAIGGPACVPLDPWGWAYLENCDVLFATNPAGMTWLPAGGPDGSQVATAVPIPDDVAGHRILSLSVLVMPESTGIVSAQLTLEGHLGTTPGLTSITILASASISESGGLLQFVVPDGTILSDVTASSIRFDRATSVAWSGSGEMVEPMVMWFGS